MQSEHHAGLLRDTKAAGRPHPVVAQSWVFIVAATLSAHGPDPARTHPSALEVVASPEY